MTRRYKVKTAQTASDNKSLPRDIEKGEILFGYSGCTYGCISSGGVACVLRDGKEPFFEIPRDALESIK